MPLSPEDFSRFWFGKNFFSCGWLVCWIRSRSIGPISESCCWSSDIASPAEAWLRSWVDCWFLLIFDFAHWTRSCLQRDKIVASCPLIHNSPVLKSQTHLCASNQSIPNTTCSTSSDTNAVVHRHFSSNLNGSRTSPLICMGVLSAAQTWRMEGLTSTLVTNQIRWN